MQHFLEGIGSVKTLIRWPKWEDKYNSSLLSQLNKCLTQHFLQGNNPLSRHLLNNETLLSNDLTEICYQKSKYLGPCHSVLTMEEVATTDPGADDGMEILIVVFKLDWWWFLEYFKNSVSKPKISFHQAKIQRNRWSS